MSAKSKKSTVSVASFKTKKASKKPPLLVVICGVILVILVAFVVWWHFIRSTYVLPSPNTKFNNTELIQKVGSLEQNGQYGDAVKLLNSQAVLNSVLTSSQITSEENTGKTIKGISGAFRLNLLAEAYAGENNYSQAISTYKQYAQLSGNSPSTSVSIAQLYSDEGNNTMAKQYYEQALSLIDSYPSSLSGVALQKSIIQNDISKLGK